MLGMVDRRNNKVYDDIFRELEEIAMKDDTLYNAFNHWEELSSTKEQRVAYEERSKQIMDEEAAKREFELRKQDAREEGLKEGLKEGKEEGREKGREEGREKGREEGIKTANEATARRFLAMGMDIEEVVKGTGLDTEKVLEIEREMQQ